MKKIKEFAEYIGIDISKNKIDVYLHFAGSHHIFENKVKGFKSLMQWLKKFNVKKGQRLFIFEYTGIYNEDLAEFLEQQGEKFSIVSGLEVKKSLGIQRGKSDLIDSKKLAEYGFRFRDKIKLTELEREEIRALKKLLSDRDYYIELRVEAENRIKNLEEGKENLSKYEKTILQRAKKTYKYADKMVKEIEAAIEELVTSTEEIKEQKELAETVPGVGKWTALFLIAYTGGFKRFNNWREFASYIGIAPFPYSSGSSLQGNSHVSYFAHKKLKAKLYFVALTAIRVDTQLKAYYDRKLEEGKHKLSVMNAVKNKVIARVFAVIKRGTPYVKLDFVV